MSSDTRERLLDAAEAVVCAQGALHLTLEQVAEQAAVSKGGLLYHFPSKNALLQAMVARYMQRMDARAEAAVGAAGDSAAARLLGFVQASTDTSAQERQLGLALLAAMANDPSLLEPVREQSRQQLQRLKTDFADFPRAAVVCLACDGLMLLETLGLMPLSDDDRAALVEALRALARDTGGRMDAAAFLISRELS